MPSTNAQTRSLSERLWTILPLLIGLYFAGMGIAYARALPLFEATDEAAHFLYVHNLLESGKLPRLADEGITITGSTVLTERWSLERHQPPLYYLIGAVLISGTERADIESYLQPNMLIFMRDIDAHNANMWLHPPSHAGDTAAAIWILRLFSLGLATVTLLLIYRTAWLAFGRRSIALVAMAFTASIPMFISLSASVNNDNLVTMLYAAGVYWSLRMWRRGITRVDIAAVSLILAGAALSKLTGLTLFGVVYLSLVIGVVRKHYSWRRAVWLVGVSLVTAALLAGWWYLRNIHLYGDPFAAKVTGDWLGRGQPGDLTGEIRRVWQSFWLGIGHLHNLLYGPKGLYTYALVICAAGLAGVGLVWRRQKAWRESLAFLLAVFGVVLIALIAATREIDISYGRILYPALVAIAPLLAVGWMALLGRKIGGIVWIPLAITALVVPVKYIPQAYPSLEAVDSVPADAVPINTRAESLSLLAYESPQEIVAPGDTLKLWLYISGQHLANPALAITLLDSVSQNPISTTEVFPAMSPSSQLNPDTIYRVPVYVEIDKARAANLPPRRLELLIDWEIPFPELRMLEWTTPDGGPIDAVRLTGPLLIDLSFDPPAPQVVADVAFGDVIRLAGYTLSPEKIAPGETLTVTLYWRYIAHTGTDWTAAVGLLDAENNVIANADGMTPGYPTYLWQAGPDFTDTRTLTLPPDAAQGDYRLYVGWYRLDNGDRLPATGDGVDNNLFFLPTPIQVE